MWLIARRKERLDELAIQLNSISKDTSIRCIQGDLSGNAGVEFVKNLFQEEQNQQEFVIDTLVNNAGYGTYGTFEDTPTAIAAVPAAAAAPAPNLAVSFPLSKFIFNKHFAFSFGSIFLFVIT